jgi:hypothetical protein
MWLVQSLGAAESAKKVTYDDHILPILKDKCVSCHNQDKTKAGLNLANYLKLMEGSSSGAVVKPGDPDASPLLLTMTHKQEPFMPPSAPQLPKETTDLIRKWIEAGALENTGSKAPVMKPKVDISLKSVGKGKPDGPPPMPGTKLPLDPLVKARRAGAVIALAANPWAPVVAVGGQKQVFLYHTETADLLGVLPFPLGTPHALKFSRNGKLLLAAGGIGGKAGKALVWDIANGEKIIEVGDETDAILAADLSADQSQIAVGGPSKMVRIYSTKDGTLLREMKKHTDWIYTVEFSPDGVLLTTGDRNGGVFVWESFTGREYFSLRGHTLGITGASWRDDSNILATTSEDGTIRLWEMENGNQVKQWPAHGGGSQWVHFAHDGRLVSVGRDRVAKVWDGNGGLQKQFENFNDLALRCAFSHDGSKIIAGDWTGTVRVWTVADAKRVAEVNTNPPLLSERLATAAAELAAQQAAHEAAAKNMQAANKRLKAVTDDLAATQKRAADLAASAKQATDSVPGLKTALDQANAAVNAATQMVQAKQAALTAATNAATQAKAATDKEPANKDKAAALAAAQAAVTKAQTEVPLAQKALADAQAVAKAANEKLTATQKAGADAAVAVKQANESVPGKQAALKPAQEAVAAAQAALTQAQAALAVSKAKHDRLKAAKG